MNLGTQGGRFLQGGEYSEIELQTSPSNPATPADDVEGSVARICPEYGSEQHPGTLTPNDRTSFCPRTIGCDRQVSSSGSFRGSWSRPLLRDGGLRYRTSILQARLHSRIETLSESSIPVECYTSRRFPPVVIRPEPGEDDSSEESEICEVRIIDNDYNTYGEVIEITMVALGVTSEEAFAVAWEVDHMGSCVVAHAPRGEAEVIANVIRTIGIEVRVNPISVGA